MDLGCIDMGCIEKQTDETFLHSDTSTKESIKMTSKVGKNKAAKDSSQSTASVLSKFTSQIKKPSHRKTSPLNWFPRKKVDSYLKRKIKLLQEVGGMNSTLDETLGDSNPHYSRVLREKIAVREAAHKAMEARKAAMVEASWCRILRAARIENKEAESLLLKAEQNANEAFEAAKAIGVIMYDIPDCPRKHYEIETSAINGGESTTHTVTASFETAFEVDKQVAAAVKSAFTRLANCPSISREEFKELLRKISENPDTGDNNNQELSGFSSDCESDTGSELELGPHKLVEAMLERLRGLQEDELASLATIVATCGLNAALAKEENIKQEGLGFTIGKKNAEEELPSLDKFLVKRLTRLEREVQEAKNARMKEANEECEERENKSHDEKVCLVDDISSSDATDLQSILVKHSSKLEKEIEEAKRKHGKLYELNGKKQEVTEVPSLDKFLVKHVSRLEREVQEAKNGRKIEPNESMNRGHVGKENIDLNKKGNREVDVRQKENSTAENDFSGENLITSEQTILEGNDERKETETGLDKIMIKPIHWSEREKAQALSSLGSDYGIQRRKKKNGGNTVATDCESLDKVLVKHVSRLEREKMGVDRKEEEAIKTKRRDVKAAQLENSEGSLDQILVKHVSRLEREKMAAAAARQLNNNQIEHLETPNTRVEKNSEGSLDQILVKHKSRLEREKMAAAAAQQADEPIKPLVGRREARERELQEAWGGLSLGYSVRPHVSRLQRDKAAWLKAEEEERSRAIEEQV